MNRVNCSFFSFVELEDVFVKDNQRCKELIENCKQLSTSHSQANYSEAINHLLEGLLQAHKACREYANSMQKFQENTYVEEFCASRTKTFDDFMITFKAANRGPLLNNFNIYRMSLPLENAPKNNFYFGYALSAQIDFQEKEERFNQLLQASSSEILRRKAKFFSSDTDFQPKLAMTCFFQGSCSIFRDPEISTSTQEQVEKCRADFERQYQKTKGSTHREQRYRQNFYSDQDSYFE